MATINSIGNNVPVQQIAPQAIRREVAVDAPAQMRVTDRLELSGLSPLLKTLKSNDVRVDKVNTVRAQIEAGTYEDDQKLDIAVDRLLDELLD